MTDPTDRTNDLIRSEKRGFATGVGLVEQVRRVWRWMAPPPAPQNIHLSDYSDDIGKPITPRYQAMDLRRDGWELWPWNFAFSGEAPQFYRHPVGSQETPTGTSRWPYGPRLRSIARRVPVRKVDEE